MTPSIISSEFFSAAFSCVAWLLALPLGITLTAGLAGFQNNSQNNAGPPRI
jgi:ABC-type transport system involved in multi-copper enzyme maturation permease subunit